MALTSDVPRDAFLYSCLVFGFPFLGLGWRLLYASHFKPRLLASWVASRNWIFVTQSAQGLHEASAAAAAPSAAATPSTPAALEFERALPFLRLVLLALLSLPLLLLVAWGLTAYHEVNHLFGLSVVLILPASLLAGFGLAHWKYSAWRLTRVSQACFFAAAMLVMSFEILTIFLADSYTFVGTSAVMLAFNMLPMIHIVFAATRSIEAKPFEDYPYTRFDKPVPRAIRERSHNASAASLRSLITEESPGSSPQGPSFDVSRQTLLLWVCALAILVAYGLLVALASDEDHEEVGFITAGAVIILDGTVFLSVLGGRLRQATRTCITLIACRIALVVFGDVYWFVGHSIMYLLLACFFVYNLFERYLPYQSRRERTKAFYEALGIDARFGISAESFSRQAPNACLRWSASHADVVALVALSCFFVVDVSLSAELSTAEIQLTESHAQYETGLLAFFLVFVFACLQLLLRLYANDEYKPTWRVLAASMLMWPAILGGGLLLYIFTTSVIIVACSAMLPPIVYLASFTMFAWRDNDYRLFSPARFRSPPMAPTLRAALTGRLPLRDYAVVFSLIVVLVLTLGLGFVIARARDPAWLGWTISAGMLILVTSLLPVVEWFNTFEVSPVMLVNAVFALGVHVTFCTLFFTTTLDADANAHPSSALGLLIFAVMYPTVVLFISAAYKWRDDDYVLSAFVRNAFVLCALLFTALCVAVALFYSPWQIGATALVIFWIGLAARLVVPRVRARHPRALKYVVMAGLGAVLAYSLVIGLEDGRGFVGFTMMAGVVFVILAALSYQERRLVQHSGSTIVYSPTLFPVFKYQVTPGLRDPLVMYNIRVWVPIALLCLCFYWGVLATYFVSLPSIGMGTMSLSLLLLYLFAVSVKRRPLLQLARAVDTLKEGSDVYLDVVAKARTRAIPAQLTHSKGINRAASGDADAGRELSRRSADSEERARVTLSNVFVSDPEQGVGVHAKGNEPWQELLARRRAFADRLPEWKCDWSYVSPSLPCGSARVAALQSLTMSRYGQVKWRHRDLNIHLALLAMLHEEAELNRAFLMQTKYQAQLSVEIIKSAESMVVEHEYAIMSMLQAAGKHSASLAVVRSLDPQSPARRELDRKLRLYIQEQEALQLRREERRRQDEEAQRRREEILAQRLREDAERHRQREEERERLLRESQAHLLEEEARAAQVEQQRKLVGVATGRDMCTLTTTGQVLSPQVYFECRTCAFVDGAGVCTVCAEVCHDGHDLVEQPEGPFYCDCGMSDCRAVIMTPEERAQLTVSSTRRRSITFLNQEQLRDAPNPAEKIIAECQASGTRFTDHEFNGDTALFADPRQPRHAAWRNFKWVRLAELKPNTHEPVYTEPVDPGDIKQGSIGDCWYMSALSVLTQRQEALARCFLTKELNEWGVYAFRFLKNGEEHVVVIDDQLPCQGDHPAFGRTRESGQMWVSLIEKAYAKLHKSYEAIEGGFVDQALVDLTGGIATRFDMRSDAVKQNIRNGQLFKQLLSYRESGFLMGAGSPSGSDSEENASRWGVIQGHAYAVLDVREVDDHQLLQLRNPWGRKEWTGDWSDGSPKWTRRLKKKLGYVNRDDGAFWMSFADFTRHFEDVYVCRFFDEPTWKTLEPIRRRWSVAENTAGGCTNFDSVKDNPMYLLDVREPCTVVLNLEQEDVRGQGKKFAAISVELYDNQGLPLERRRCGRLVASNPDGYIFRREVVVQVELQPTEHPYTVLVSTFNPGMERRFVLKVMSTEEVGFTKLS